MSVNLDDFGGSTYLLACEVLELELEVDELRLKVVEQAKIIKDSKKILDALYLRVTVLESEVKVKVGTYTSCSDSLK